MSPGEKETTAEVKRICLACGQTFTDVTRCPKDGNPLVLIKRKDSMIGQVIGGCYEVQSVLGRGGMSTVYKGRHTLMNRLVALKVLSSHDPYSLKRFHMEAQLAASLSHVNIITVFDFGLSKDGDAFLAMDFIDGKTLAETVASGGPMEFTRAIPMFEQACDALAYAHKQGVIHRDLKPSNFLISVGSAGEDVLKLLDFGIAKQLEPGENYQTLTATGQVFGSPLYMSPEQCMGLKLDPRADVYSLGCVMYEVLTGRPPFIGKTPLDTMQMHVHEDATPPSRAETLPIMPERLEDIILKAVERDIEDRYQNITDLWNDLKELEEDPGRLANSELDTAQIFVEIKQQVQGKSAYAVADTDPNSVSMQQLHLMAPALDNLSQDFQQSSLFDTSLNSEIDQRIKSGLAVETQEDDEPPAVPLDVTRQTIALLNELQKGSQLLSDGPNGETADGVEPVEAPPVEPKQLAKEKETALSESDIAQFRRPRSFGGPIFLSPHQGSIKLGAVSAQSSPDAEAEVAASTSSQSVLDTGELPPIVDAPATKQFPSPTPAAAAALDPAKAVPLEPVIAVPVNVVPSEPARVVPVQPAKAVPVQPAKVVPVQPAKVVPSEPVKALVLEPAKTVQSEPGKAVQSEPGKGVQPEPARSAQSEPVIPAKSLSTTDSQSGPATVVPARPATATPTLPTTQAFNLAAVQAISNELLTRIPKRIASIPTPLIVAFIVLILVTFICAVIDRGMLR